jgi:tRNA-specific 2-thiouridylase
MKKNTITVSQHPEKFQTEKKDFHLEMTVDSQNIFFDGMELEAQIRYRGKVKKVKIVSYDKEKRAMNILFNEADASIAVGQSVVFYSGNICLGGGILT